MYTPSTLQSPRGHMKRPRTYAIGHKVNSLLFEPSLSACETWLLPHAWTLHTLRYNQDDHGESKDQGQAWKRRRKKGEEEDGATVGARPDIRTVVRIIRAQPDHPDPARTSGPPAGHPALRLHQPSLRIIRASTRTIRTSPDHPASDPDHPASTCVRVLG